MYTQYKLQQVFKKMFDIEGKQQKKRRKVNKLKNFEFN